MEKHILEAVEKGFSLGKGKRILHSAPHHDDIMLAYYPLLPRFLKEAKNAAVYIVSGTNGVKEEYLSALEKEYKAGNADLAKLFEDAENSLEVKARLRESEADSLWQELGLDLSLVHHLRSAFYYNMKKLPDDVKAIGKLLDDFKPDAISLALDPKGQGPRTHFNALIALLQALEGRDIEIWAYRNVWSKYSIEEANVMLPCKLEEMEAMKTAFHKAFKSQVDAAFPAKNAETTFPQVAAKHMHDQYIQIRDILKKKYFSEHMNIAIRKAKGFIFLRVLPVQTLIEELSNELS